MMTTSSSSEPFTVEVTDRAAKDIARQRTHRSSIYKALSRLEHEPYRGHLLAGSLKGVRALAFSVPGVAFRACYVVQPERKRCIVFLIGPHENIYDEAERRYAALLRRDALSEET